MCRRIAFSLIVGAATFAVAGCSSDSSATPDAAPADAAPVDAATPDAGGPLFVPQPECQGAEVVPLSGDHAVVVSSLAIGDIDDGFDLDRDGEPDNQLFPVRDLAKDPIAEALSTFQLVIPVELFDFPTAGADECVKAAFYIGSYKKDGDADTAETAIEGGDCNDLDGAIKPGAAEVAGNLKDDDCDGLADETGDTASTDEGDADEDGVTILAGDCDDTNAAVLGGQGAVEVCGDGLDNNCDGAADYGLNGDGSPACTPLDLSPDEVGIQATSVDENGDPLVAFKSGEVKSVDGVLKFSAGPSLFRVEIPIYSGIALDLALTGATIEATVSQDENGGITLTDGRIGGVIDARTADSVRGLDVEVLGLDPEDSFLDVIFAGGAGGILQLPSLVNSETGEWPDWCRTPDIDVDGDGLEGFCDTDGDMDVDMCVDGDLTVVSDEVDADGEVTVHCTDATDDDGNYRFVDGISVELNFGAVPTILPEAISN